MANSYAQRERGRNIPSLVPQKRGAEMIYVAQGRNTELVRSRQKNPKSACWNDGRNEKTEYESDQESDQCAQGR